MFRHAIFAAALIASIAGPALAAQPPAPPAAKFFSLQTARQAQPMRKAPAVGQPFFALRKQSGALPQRASIRSPLPESKDAFLKEPAAAPASKPLAADMTENQARQIISLFPTSD